MRYRRVEIEEFDTWKVNKIDIDNKSYPDFIKEAIDKGIIVFYKSLLQSKPNSVIGVLNEGQFGKCFSEDYHITCTEGIGGKKIYGTIFSQDLYNRYLPVREDDPNVWLCKN